MLPYMNSPFYWCPLSWPTLMFDVILASSPQITASSVLPAYPSFFFPYFQSLSNSHVTYSISWQDIPFLPCLIGSHNCSNLASLFLWIWKTIPIAVLYRINQFYPVNIPHNLTLSSLAVNLTSLLCLVTLSGYTYSFMPLLCMNLSFEWLKNVALTWLHTPM